MPAIFEQPYRIGALGSVPWALRTKHWQASITTIQVVKEPLAGISEIDPEQHQRFCGNFVIRQGMKSWTKAERDAFISEFGYI